MQGNAWARGYGLFGRLGGDANARSADYRGGGVFGGIDRQFVAIFSAGRNLFVRTRSRRSALAAHRHRRDTMAH